MVMSCKPETKAAWIGGASIDPFQLKQCNVNHEKSCHANFNRIPFHLIFHASSLYLNQTEALGTRLLYLGGFFSGAFLFLLPSCSLSAGLSEAF